MNLKDNAQMIAQYIEVHSRENAWSEVIDGIKSVGILDMQIYLLGNRLFMVVETPLDFDWDTAMTKLSTLPRQAEWEAFTAIFQDCKPGSTSAEKWKLMERIFYLYDEM